MTLTPQELDALKNITSPTVANAIETFKVRPRHEGFMSSGIRASVPAKAEALRRQATTRRSPALVSSRP